MGSGSQHKNRAILYDGPPGPDSHSVRAYGGASACNWLPALSCVGEIDRRTKALPANPRRSPPPPHPNATCLHLEVTSTRLKRLPPHAGLVPLWIACPGSAGIRQRFFVLARTGHIHLGHLRCLAKVLRWPLLSHFRIPGTAARGCALTGRDVPRWPR